MAEYDPADDARRCYDLGIAAWREKLIRLGDLPAVTEQERRWAAEGRVHPSQLGRG